MIAVVVDRSRPLELAHARAQTGRLRRAGLEVVEGSRRLPGGARSVAVVYAVGPGRWGAARRLARRLGAPLVYDHPAGARPPGRLARADAVVAPGHSEAAALRRRLGGAAGRVALVGPELRLRCGFRPRLRARLEAEGRTIAIQEAADLSARQALGLLRAASSMAEVDVAFLGGDRWPHRAAIAEAAAGLGMGERVHLLAPVPAARRPAYLAEADLGLALGRPPRGRGGLPATDLYALLGMPFVALAGSLDPAPPGCIEADPDPDALRAAIREASGRPRLPSQDDGAQALEALLAELASPEGEGPLVPSAGRAPRSGGARPPGTDPPATALLRRARAIRERGDVAEALDLYARIVADSGSPEAIATAAADLARLNARAEARGAIDRVLKAADGSPLATARVAEAAAALGDLREARAHVDRVLSEGEASQPALRTAIRVLEQAGEPRIALRVAREAGEEAAVARNEGTLETYDPTWLPAVAGAGAGADTPPPRPGSSLVLLETSLPHLRSGYTYRARTLLRAQRRAGVEPTVLTRLGFPVTRGLSAPPVETVDGVVHHRGELPGVQRYTSVPVSEQLRENVRWAATIEREVRPEGIVATTPHLNGLVGLALRDRFGTPVVYDVRGFPEMTWAVRDGGRESDAFALRRIAETRCMREADLVTTLSETMREQIVSRGVPPENVFVLPHAVDTEAFAPSEPDRELAASLGLAGRKVVGYISSLVAYEGVETLIEAIALARQADPGVAGLIVGDGELLPSLEAQARSLGLEGHVVFTGRVDAGDVLRYYSVIDVFVCPRRDHEVTRYVTPLKPFEAMAAGCCLVVSDLPTLREAVRDGECGALFPAEDSGALADAVLGLLAAPDRRAALQSAARAHALAGHSLDVLSSRFELVWEELRSRAGGGRPSGALEPLLAS